MSLLRNFGMFVGGLFPRPQLPIRYSDGWQAGTPLDATQQAPITGFSALRRGLDIINGQLVSTPLLAFDANGKEVTNRALENLSPAHLAAAAAHMMEGGNGFLQLQNGAFVCIPSSRVTVLLDNAGVPHYRLDDGSELDMATTCHLMHRNSVTPYAGDSLLEAYNLSIGAVGAALSIYRQIQGNGSFAETILSTDTGLTRAQMIELRAAYEEQAGNAKGKAGGTIILGAGLKPATVRRLPTSLEADIVASMNFSVEEAARMTGVPLAWLSTREVSGGYNSSIEASRAFYRTVMKPIFGRVEKELSRVLGVRCQYDVQEILLGSGVERADVLSKLIQVGVLNIDEARASIAYGPIENGTIHAMPLNTAPLPVWAKPPPEPTAGAAIS